MMPITSSSELVHFIEAQIADGFLTSGDRLPTVRAYANELNLAPNTVAAAYKRLRDRGAVVGKARQGTIVAPQTRAQLPSYPSVPDGLIDAMSGNPDSRLLPDLAAAFTHLPPAAPAIYGGPLIDSSLAAYARQSFSADGVDTANLTVTSGAMDAVERVLATQGLRPGDRIGVEDPGHGPVHTLARRMGLDLVPLSVDTEGIEPASLAAALAEGLGAVVATPRAQNPTGATFSPERVASLNETMADYPSLCLICDDHAGDVAGSPYLGLTPPGRRWATIRSMAKTLGPDLRLAMVGGDSETIDALSLDISDGPGWVSHLLQRLAAHLMTDASTANMIKAARLSYQHRRELLISELATHGIEATGKSGLSVWIPTGDEQAAVDRARTAGFAIRAADSYRLASARAVRVTITSLDEDQIVRVAAAIGGRGSHRTPTA